MALANSEMASKRILVVDDMAIISQGTALMLESFGYSADQAASGAEAIERFKTTEYAAIIMDFNMPEMNGFECTAKNQRARKWLRKPDTDYLYVGGK